MAGQFLVHLTGVRRNDKGYISAKAIQAGLVPARGPSVRLAFLVHADSLDDAANDIALYAACEDLHFDGVDSRAYKGEPKG